MASQVSEQQSPPIARYITEKNMLSFPIPRDATSDQRLLATDIASLDFRRSRRFKPDSAESKLVVGLLENAANMAFMYHQVAQAKQIYQEAEKAYFSDLEASNRLKYLIGVHFGVFVATGVTLALKFLISRYLAVQFISQDLLILMCLFAGIGSLTSVLTRLTSIDLKIETNTTLLIISGGAKPVVAIFFSLVIYLILNLKVIDMEFGSPTENNKDFIYLISAFLSGFSERFAKDILSRVAPAGS